MKDWLISFWERLHTSFWFLPTAMAAVAAAAALGAVDLDRVAGSAFAKAAAYIWSGGAEGARSLLSTIAGSMITVAGTVFSITIVSLTLASSQFGPRLLRNFVRDTGNQVVLGTFTSTFLYCILVLRTIRSKDEGAFIPYIAITLAVGLAVASLGVLIYFIHHVSVSIQAENLIAKVGAELSQAIERHFPLQGEEAGDAERVSAAFREYLREGACREVPSLRSGYLQTVDREGLVRAAERTGTRLVLRSAPGDFVLAGEPLLEVWSRQGEPDTGIAGKEATKFFKLGDQRTEEQDVRYGARQLAEIAARALSPGVNDPYTAMGCIDWITDALARVSQRGPALQYVLGKNGAPVLEQHAPGFESLCEATWEPLIAFGLDDALVARRMVQAVERVAHGVKRPEHAETLQHMATRLEQQTSRMLEDAAVLERVQARLEVLQQRLGAVLAAAPPDAGGRVTAATPANLRQEHGRKGSGHEGSGSNQGWGE